MDAYGSSHISEDMLERFALNQLTEEELAPLESHILVCHRCQDHLEQVDEYVQSMKEAMSAPAGRPDAISAVGRFLPQRQMMLVWSAVVIVVMVVAVPMRRSERAPTEVTLTAPRGGDSLPIAHGRAGAGLLLRIDVTEVVKAESYWLEVVDADGHPVWRAQAYPDHNRLEVPVPNKLGAGKYWVRLFDKSQPPVAIREYGLELY
jgi:hypothetical protein